MAGLKLVLKAITLFAYYVLIWLIFPPIKLLRLIGDKAKIRYFIRRLVLFSDQRSNQIRDDLTEGINEGAEKILEHQEIDNILVHRHQYRREGLRAAREAENKLATGEVVISSFY